MAADQQARIEILADAKQAIREFADFGGRVSDLSTRVQGYIGGIQSSVTGLMGRMSALAALVGAGAFAAGVRHQIELQDATRKSAQAAGVSVEAFDELAYAAKLADTDTDSLTKGLGKLSNAIFKAASGEPNMKELFADTLGVKVRDANGNLRATDAIIEDLAGKFAEMHDGAVKTATAGQLFGEKMGPRLIPFLNQGKEGIQQLREELRKLRGTTTEESSAMAEQFNDNMTRMGVAAERLKFTIANKVLPTLTEFSNFFVQATKDVGTLEAAWLTFGKTAARVLKFDDIGMAKRELLTLTGHTKALERAIADLQPALDRNPKDDGLKARIQSYKDKLAEVQAKAETTRATIQRLQQEQVPEPSKPRTGPETVEEGPPKESRVPGWANLLEEQKKAYADGMALQGQFTEWTHAEESRFWQGILERSDLSQAEKVGVTSHYLAAERAMRKQAAAANLAEQQFAIEEARNQYQKQEELTAEYVKRVGEMYGLDSKEYQQALRSQLQQRREHETHLREMANVRREASMQDRLEEIADQERDAEMQRTLGLITQQQLLQIRARTIEQRREIELQAKLAELEAEKGGPNDPVTVERIQAEIAAIKRRYKGLSADNQGQQKVEQADPLRAIFGVGEQQLQQGLQSVLTNFRITGAGIRSAAAQIGSSVIAELVTKPFATWVSNQARMLAMTWLFGEEKVAAEAATQGEITAVQAAGSLKTIAMRAYEAAAGAYSAIAAIPYVGPVLAPVAAGVALAGVMAFAKSIFSAEGGFDIPKGMNPIVQTHANEMILPSRHADTIRQLGDMFASGRQPALGGGAVTIKAIPMPGDFFMLHRTQLVKALKAAGRNFEV